MNVKSLAAAMALSVACLSTAEAAAESYALKGTRVLPGRIELTFETLEPKPDRCPLAVTEARVQRSLAWGTEEGTVDLKLALDQTKAAACPEGKGHRVAVVSLPTGPTTPALRKGNYKLTVDGGDWGALVYDGKTAYVVMP